MATIDQRTLADGRIRYWVKWRLGGTRTDASQSEPFDTHADAHTFKLPVEAADHQWPENWLRRQGWAPGWVPGHGWVRTDEEDDEPKDVRTWINHLRTGVPDPTAPHRTSAPGCPASTTVRARPSTARPPAPGPGPTPAMSTPAPDLLEPLQAPGMPMGG